MTHASPEVTPEEAGLGVVRRLRERGFVAYFAGGCVRDRLLGCPATDVDVATDATPDQVRSCFRRTLEVGEAFAVVRVLERGVWIEVATFRVDGSYRDGRRPEGVRFASPDEDAHRRDFTINGMFFDPLAHGGQGEVIDFVGGRADLAKGVVRAIGDPEARFAEDRLRLLRAPRFAARFGFTLDPTTAAAARLHAPELASSGVSAERIHVELEKILAHPSRGRGLELTHDLGLLRHVLPEAAVTPGPVFAALAALPERLRDVTLAWAVALHPAGPDGAWAALERLKASNHHRDRTRAIVEGLTRGAAGLLGLPVAARTRFLRRPEVPDTLLGLRALATAARGDLARVAALDACYEALADDPTPTGLRARPLVGGADLKAAGVPPGPAYARVLAQVEDAQLEGRVRDREAALALALELVRGA